MLFLLKKLLAPILFIIRSVRRALCCFRMKSKQSCSLDDTNYLTHIGIVPNKTEENFDWDDDKWGMQEGRGVRKKPLTVQDHITSYREQLNQSNNNADDEVLNNIFEELAPQMITQKRVVIDQEDQAKISEPKNVSRLSVNTNFSNGELVDWVEEVSTGWDEQFIDPMDVLKEYKKQNRENRKQQTIGRKLNN